MRQQLEQERVDGEAARQVIDNPIYRNAWTAVRESIIAQMEEVKMRDNDMHTRLILAMQIMNSVHREIERTMETGKLADMQLREPNKLSRIFGR